VCKARQGSGAAAAALVRVHTHRPLPFAASGPHGRWRGAPRRCSAGALARRVPARSGAAGKQGAPRGGAGGARAHGGAAPSGASACIAADIHRRCRRLRAAARSKRPPPAPPAFALPDGR
jgi:hypothetical protein